MIRVQAVTIAWQASDNVLVQLLEELAIRPILRRLATFAKRSP
jgi:hypothetical protein